jgi:hypothetical protein
MLEVRDMSDTTIIVDLTNEHGETIGRSIPVTVEYMVCVDEHYGADADGNQGTLLIEREIIDKSIDVPNLMTMDSGQVERALADVEAIFYERSRLGRF